MLVVAVVDVVAVSDTGEVVAVVEDEAVVAIVVVVTSHGRA